MKHWRVSACSAAIATALLMTGCGSGGDSETVAAPVTPPAAPACPAQLSVGYRVVTIAGIKAAVWYPTTEAEAVFNYSSSTSTSLAANDRYLKGSDPALLNGSGAGLLLYQKQLQ